MKEELQKVFDLMQSEGCKVLVFEEFDWGNNVGVIFAQGKKRNMLVFAKNEAGVDYAKSFHSHKAFLLPLSDEDKHTIKTRIRDWKTQ